MAITTYMERVGNRHSLGVVGFWFLLLLPIRSHDDSGAQSSIQGRDVGAKTFVSPYGTFVQIREGCPLFQGASHQGMYLANRMEVECQFLFCLSLWPGALMQDTARIRTHTCPS